MSKSLHNCLLTRNRFARTHAWLYLFVCGLSTAFAQQNVNWRSESTTPNWWDGANPWVYQFDGFQQRPNLFTPNFVAIGNNTFTTMFVNGQFFNMTSLTINSSANLDRIYNVFDGGGFSFVADNSGLFVDTSANQTFNVPVGVDAATIRFRGNSGSSNIGFTSDFFLNGNTAQFGGDSGNTTITVSGVMSGTGGQVLKQNANVLVLTGNNSYTGGTEISGGTLRIGHDNALGTGTYRMTGSSGITSNDTATRNIANVLGTFAGSSANYTFGSSTGSLNGDLNFNNTTPAALSATSAARTFTVHNTTAFANAFTSGGSSIAKNGAGTLVLLGNSSFGGGMTLNEGVIRAGHANALGSGTLTVANTAGAKTLASNDATARTLSNAITLDNSTTTFQLGQSSGGTGSLTLAGNVNTGGSGITRRLTLVGNHEISGAISGSRGIAKQGTGTLTLSGNQSQGEGLFIDNSLVRITAGSVNIPRIDIGGGVTVESPNNASLEITNPISITADLYARNFDGIGGTRALTFSNGSGTATVTGNLTLDKLLSVSSANAATITGAVTGGGGLTKTGAGLLTLSGGGHTFQGDTTVSQGTLATAATFIDSNVTVGASGTFDVSATSGGYAVTQFNHVTSSGALVGGSNGFVVQGGTFTQNAGTWSTDVFHVLGSGGAVDLADLAYSTDGDLIFTFDASGTTAVNLTDNNPFALYGGGLGEWANNWEITVQGNLNPQDFPSTITLMSASLYDLENLDGLLTINAKNSFNGPATFTNVADGDEIFLGGIAGFAKYEVNFSANSLDLELVPGSAQAIPEPGTLSLIGLALFILRLRLRKK